MRHERNLHRRNRLGTPLTEAPNVGNPSHTYLPPTKKHKGSMTNQPLGCIWENRESLILRHPWAVDTAARIVPPHPRFCWPTKETWQSPLCSKKRTDRCSHRKKARKDPKCVSRFPERIYTSSLARFPAVRPCLCELPLPQQAQFSEDRTKCLTSDQPCLKHSFK